MKRLLRSCLLASLLLSGLITASAQSPSGDLRKGIQSFYTLLDFVDLFGQKLEIEDFKDLKTYADSSLFYLNRTWETLDTGDKKVATYFMFRTMLEYGKALERVEQYQVAYDELKPMQETTGSFSPAFFPVEYEYENERRSVSWDSFTADRADYYEVLGSVCARLEKYDEAVTFTRKYLSGEYTTPEQNLLAINVLFDIRDAKPELVSDEDFGRDVLNYLRSYLALDADLKEVLEEAGEYLTGQECCAILAIESIKPDASPSSIGFCAQAADLVSSDTAFASQALQLYEISFRNYRSDARPGLIYAFVPELPAYEFARKAESLARSMSAAAPVRAEFVGLSATAQLAVTAFDDTYKVQNCSKLEQVADNYKYWKKPDEESKYRKLAESCRKDREKADRLAARRYRADNSAFNFYTGIYIPQLIASNERRDYGGVVNLINNRFGMEFSYLQIRQKKENIFDMWIREVDNTSQDNLSRWDGFYAHIQPKFFNKEGTASYSYIGALMGYASKDFAPMDVQVTRDSDGSVSLATFDPSVRQYILMATFGAMVLKKGFGADIFWSLGANYSTFNPGTSINRAEYTISNPLLEARYDSYFGFIMRFGLTIGLNIGSGR